RFSAAELDARHQRGRFSAAELEAIAKDAGKRALLGLSSDDVFEDKLKEAKTNRLTQQTGREGLAGPSELGTVPTGEFLAIMPLGGGYYFVPPIPNQDLGQIGQQFFGAGPPPPTPPGVAPPGRRGGTPPHRRSPPRPPGGQDRVRFEKPAGFDDLTDYVFAAADNSARLTVHHGRPEPGGPQDTESALAGYLTQLHRLFPAADLVFRRAAPDAEAP